MHKLLITATSIAVFFTFGKVAQATDILSHDINPHILTIIEGETERSVDLDAMGELRDVCNGCTIALEDGQTVTAKATDTITIIDGKLIPDE
ncbi:MAG: hypothetical protein OQK24_13125 [Magnetovibrio sp.]|nr:hypothetical protein [Magnetovibrio sp.]